MKEVNGSRVVRKAVYRQMRATYRHGAGCRAVLRSEGGQKELVSWSKGLGRTIESSWGQGEGKRPLHELCHGDIAAKGDLLMPT